MTDREFATDVVRKLRAEGFQALFAGGCVRDQLLGIEPHDFDVATDARPDQVQSLFRRTVAVGASFGVIEVLGRKPLKVQVATFRCDDEYDDGRHPRSVTFSTPEEDARRRDFTINGLFFDPIDEKVIDFVGGEADLRDKVIRAIGNPMQRLTEDKLRLIRAVRFAARFHFNIEPATWEALRVMANRITSVSAERIADELRKILTDPSRATGIDMLQDAGLLQSIVPELPAGSSPDRNAVLAQLADPVAFPLGLAALLLPLGPQLTADVAERLRLSNAESNRIVWLVRRHDALNEAELLPKSVLKPILAHDDIRDLLVLHRAIARAENRSEAHIEFCERCLREWPAEVINPPPLITGDDLRDLGMTPGPTFKRLLDAIRAAQLNEEISTHDEATALAQKLRNS
jgi:poly(A) polymerase